MSSKVTKITVIDIDPNVIRESKLHYKSEKVEFMTGYALDIPFGDNEFDAIVTFENIEHVSDYKAYLMKIKRVLKANEMVLLSTPNNRDIPIRIKKLIKNYRDWSEKYQPNKWHIKELYLDGLREKFNDYKSEFDYSFGQLLRIPKSTFSKNPVYDCKVLFNFFGKIARYTPKYRVSMVFELKKLNILK